MINKAWWDKLKQVFAGERLIRKYMTSKTNEAQNTERKLEHNQLIEDLDDAFVEWKQAQVRFDYALGPDETDYAIFTMEAAEKRLTMLLKKAKRMQVRTSSYRQLLKEWSA